MSSELLAAHLYESYCDAVGGKAFNGDPLPKWEAFRADPSKKIQSDAWVTVAFKSRCGLVENATRLCWAIEELPASKQQTDVSLMAAGLLANLRG